MLTKNDLSQIKTAVQTTIQPKIEALGMEIKAIKKTMATKDDIKNMATKSDLKSLESRIRSDMSTKEDLKSMATKEDLKILESRLLEKIDDAQMEIIATVDKHKADKETVGILEKRVDRLEENAGLPPLD